MPLLTPLADPALDLTELPGTGSLYDGGDVIEQAEQLAAAAFGARETLFSAGGCTLCIQTMLLLGAGAGGRVLMARTAHRSAVHTAVLLGFEPVWLWPSQNKDGVLPPDADAVERRSPRIPASVRCMSPVRITRATSAMSRLLRRYAADTVCRCWWITPTAVISAPSACTRLRSELT